MDMFENMLAAEDAHQVIISKISNPTLAKRITMGNEAVQ